MTKPNGREQSVPKSHCTESMTVAQAGSLGGKALLRRHGREHFSRIGSHGQASLRVRYPNMSRVWGQSGGRPRKKTLAEMQAEEGKSKRKDGDPPRDMPSSTKEETPPL